METAPVLEALKGGDHAAFARLLEGVDAVDQPDEHGWTLLSWAAGRGDVDAIRLLVEKGADVFQRGRDGRTPYLIALAAGRVEAAQALRAAEEDQGGDLQQTSSRQAERRVYCRAYPLAALREFPAWDEAAAGGEGDSAAPLAEGDVVFLHQDFTVTRSALPGQRMVFSSDAAGWRDFCRERLGFAVPSDFDLVAAG